MFRLALELLGLYLLYKVIFDFIIPLSTTTKQVKKQFGDMQEQMKGKMNEFNAQQPGEQYKSTTSSVSSKADDYIEFEEVK